MVRRVDQRTLHYEPDDEALAEVAARRADWLEQQLALARLFCRIDRRAAFIPAGCSSVAEFASRRGYDGPRARELCRLGYALAAEPALAGLLRANQIGFPAACAIGRIHQDPLLLAPDDEWVHWARFGRLRDLRRRIRERVESVRQQRPADRPFSAYVTARTAEKVDRCREVASQRAGVMLTNGQLLDVFSTGYLLENDVLERGEPEREGPGDGEPGDMPEQGARGRATGTRRLPPTDERPHDRTIPAEVSRALEERSGGLCEFGACERPATESCHLVPHRDGSGREVADLVRGCRVHHKAFDAGLLRFLGFTRADDALGAGLPVFQVVGTNEILQPKPRRRPGSTAGVGEEQPAWLLRALGKRLRRRLLGRALGRRRPRPRPQPPSPPSPEADVPDAGSSDDDAPPNFFLRCHSWMKDGDPPA
jgi:hypothetical protein